MTSSKKLQEHTKDRNTEDEFMADVYAHRLLLEKGYIKSAELISKLIKVIK